MQLTIFDDEPMQQPDDAPGSGYLDVILECPHCHAYLEPGEDVCAACRLYCPSCNESYVIEDENRPTCPTCDRVGFR